MAETRSPSGRPIRVLILRHGYYPGDPRVQREATALARHGHAVQVVCLREPGQPRRERIDGVDVIRVSVGHQRGSRIRYIGEYAAFLGAATAIAAGLHLRRRFDVVQANTMPDVLVFAAIVPRLLGAPVVLDLHELVPELWVSKYGGRSSDLVPRLLAKLEQASIRFSTAAIAVSQPCLDRYVDRGARPGQFTVVMNSADPVLFTQRPRRRTTGGPFRVVSHGTLTARYGFDLLIDAVASLEDVELEILGDGEMLALLDQRASELGLGSRVRLVGRVPLEIIPIRIADADVGVVANRSDDFTELVLPTKLLEYVAVGVPVVAPRTRAVTAYFDADCLELFRPGDTGDLARAISQACHDPEAAQSKADRALAVFEAAHGWSVMADRYVQLLESLAGRRPP